MPDKTGIGIIGCGQIGIEHAHAYIATGRAEIIAVCDIDQQRMDELGNDVGATCRYKDYKELLDNRDVQAVSICVGTAWHRETALAALAAGKHVLLEKPMALNSLEAQDIRQSAQGAKGILQIGMLYRYRPEVRVLREWACDGCLGEIYHMRAVMVRRRGVPGLGGWFTTKRHSGGGPLIDMGVHIFDLAMYISGHWNPTSVSAQTYSKFGPRMKDYKYVSMWAGPPKYEGRFDVEDYATGMVRFSDKVTLSFDLCWAANVRDESFVEVLGENAGARVLDGQPLRILTEHQDRTADILPQYDHAETQWLVQMEHFLAACRGEAPPVATAEQGYIVMKTIDAIYASSKAGQEVAIR